MTDDNLLLLLKEGDASAYDQLYYRYWKKLYSHVHLRVDDREAAKDIVQNLFINIWDRRGSLHVKGNLEAFLFGAAKLQVLNYFRSAALKQKILQQALYQMQLVESSAEERMFCSDLEKTINAAIDEMPDTMRQIFLMKNNDHSVAEIASELGLSDRTVYNNASEAVKRIRRMLILRHPERNFTCLAAFLFLLNK